MKPDLQPVARLDGLVAVTVFLTALFLYVHTAAPGLLLGDSAELQTQAYALGHTHPTGYPVYVLAARTFTSLTWGDLAGRVNLFSAFCAAAGLAALYLCGRLLGGWRVAALIGPLALALTPLYWLHAAIAELYAPAVLLLAVVVYALLMARERKNPRWLMAAALVGGLSLGVHPTVALAAPAAALYVAGLQLAGKWRAALGGGAIGVALALSAFFVIDLVNAPASYFNTVVGPSVSVWGLSPADLAQPWGRLAFSIEARQFQRLMATDPANSLSAQGPFYLETLQNMWPAAALVLALLGAAALLILQPREGLLWGVALLTQVAFVLNYGVSDIQVFYIPGYALIALAVSRGAAVIQEGLARAIRRERSLGAQQLASFAGLAIALAVAWPSLPVVQQAWVEQQPPGLDELGFGDYPYPIHDPDGPLRDAQALVDAIDDDAIVFTGWDRLYPSVFVAHVLEGRSGIAFHEAQPQDGETRLADSTLAYIDSNWQTRPIYFLERPGPEVLARYQLERGNDLFKIVGERAP